MVRSEHVKMSDGKSKTLLLDTLLSTPDLLTLVFRLLGFSLILSPDLFTPLEPFLLTLREYRWPHMLRHICISNRPQKSVQCFDEIFSSKVGSMC